DSRARTGHGVDDLARRRVDDLVVIRLQANADLLSRHCLLSLYRRLTIRGRVTLGHWTHVGAVHASALRSSGLAGSGSWSLAKAAPLFCCHSRTPERTVPDLLPCRHARTPVRRCRIVSFCCPRPRTLRLAR